MPTAIVNFRTLPNGSYRYMRGLRRGYWRVLIVSDPAGPKRLGAHNVLDCPYAGPEGLDGVTPRSRYYIGWTYAKARAVADRLNNAVSHTPTDFADDMRHPKE